MSSGRPQVLQTLCDTNQQFFNLPNDLIDRLNKGIGFELCGPRDEQESIVRFVTD